MLERIFIAGSLGALFGYLNGFFVSYNSALIKLSFIILIISLAFVKFFKRDKFLKSLITYIFIFLGFFILSSIRSHLINVENKKIEQKANLVVQIKNINIKDNTIILESKIKENKNRDLDNIFIDKDIVLYTNNFLNKGIDFYPDDILEINGEITNYFIILPKKDGLANEVKSFNLARYWQAKGYDFVSMYPEIKKINTTENKSWRYYSYIFRKSFHNNLDKVMENENSAVLMAMLWGDETKISKELNNKYVSSGVSHILVLSGYNLIIIISFIMYIFKSFSIRFRAIITLLSLTIFLLLANSGVTVFRAAVMSFYSIWALYLLKPDNSKFALWLTVFIFVLYSPILAIYDMSFHLSILATMSIIYFYPLLRGIFIKDKFKNKKYEDKNCEEIKKDQILNSFSDLKIFLFLKESLIITVSANILIFPYLIFAFGYIKITGIFLTIFISIFVPLIMFFGFLAGLFGYVSYYISYIFGFMANILISPQQYFVSIFYQNKPIFSEKISFFTLVSIYFIMFILYRYLIFNNSVRVQNKK